MFESAVNTAKINQKAAQDLLNNLEIQKAWESVGATVHLVGSLKTGLLVNHRDIDLHVYTYPLSVEKSFQAISRIASHPEVLRIQYVNGMGTEEQCLEWHLFCQDMQGREWQLDIIHIQPNSRYDGHFERVAEGILQAMTPEQKEIILQLKYATPEAQHIPGIEYCRAVLEDGVRDWNEFLQWRAENADIFLLDWIPGVH